MARRTALPALALLIFLASALPAHATEIVQPPAPKGSPQADSPAGALLEPGARAAASRNLLWATVNVCDTFEAPDAMGLRASMPGNGTRERMYMRFSAQWYSSLHGWLDVAGARSPWIYAGSARYRARQAGWSFAFQTPSFGTAYILRGTVQYQWRARRHHTRARRASYRIARERSLLTITGIRGVRGGDPKGTSKAMCAIANVG
jgi:hypothetical protein